MCLGRRARQLPLQWCDVMKRSILHNNHEEGTNHRLSRNSVPSNSGIQKIEFHQVLRAEHIARLKNHRDKTIKARTFRTIPVDPCPEPPFGADKT